MHVWSAGPLMRRDARAPWATAHLTHLNPPLLGTLGYYTLIFTKHVPLLYFYFLLQMSQILQHPSALQIFLNLLFPPLYFQVYNHSCYQLNDI